MSMDWLPFAKRIISPNFNERPILTAIDLLVIHNISLPPGQFGGPFIEQLFCNRLNVNDHPYFSQIHQLKVSAHVLIQRDGQVIQFVPFSKRAWHAGVSSFEARENCNDYSIGIELEGTDDVPYTSEQYTQLVCITKQIQQIFPSITKERIVGHNIIAPLRKTDPGSVFDWTYYRSQLD